MLQVVSAAAALAAGCTTDLDCSLNGVCADNACVCDKGWTAEDCGAFDLGKTVKENGFFATNESSWGGTMLRSMIQPDGQSTMLASHMTEHCGLGAWNTNSEIGIMTAPSPLGPYTQAGTAVPRFAHNPFIMPGPKGGPKYILYHIGCGANANGTFPVKTDCSGGTSSKPFPKPGGPKCNGPHYTRALTSDSIDGPWEDHGEVTLNTTRSVTYTTNPSMWWLPDGSAITIYRQAAAGSERLGFGWTGKPCPVPGVKGCEWQGGDFIFDFAIEDQYLWADQRGNLHVITHKKGPGGLPGDAGHFYSADMGKTWTMGYRPPYTDEIAIDDGSVQVCGKRARPMLVLSEDGAPEYLLTGCSVPDMGDGRVRTTVQPINGVAKETL
eukprot:TRINITY_DN101_c0_g1_i1.p1 TRINITY_DN101_c0_g1~~TRINITY_DN101_c0_g1_i1.p1  ORF type:complete len:382 (+),score=129.96 TRINITY_DN101_c0_g1_i1:60-1205(+)